MGSAIPLPPRDEENEMSAKLTPEQKRVNSEARKAARLNAKTQARIETERSQKPIASLTIVIEWRTSRTWGHTPRAVGDVVYTDGTCGKLGPVRTSGCGYDKTSAVIAELFNACLLYKLWELPEQAAKGGRGDCDKGPAPYGIYCDGTHRRYADGGIGVNCFFKI